VTRNKAFRFIYFGVGAGRTEERGQGRGGETGYRGGSGGGEAKRGNDVFQSSSFFNGVTNRKFSYRVFLRFVLRSVFFFPVFLFGVGGGGAGVRLPCQLLGSLEMLWRPFWERQPVPGRALPQHTL